MAKLYNLAKVTTPTTGTGTITLGSAVDGFLTFAGAGVQNGEEVTYAIKDGSNSEIGRGVYTASGTTLTRSVLKSTNSDAAINLSGNAMVFITAAAEDFDAKSDVTRQASVKTGNYTLASGDAGDVVIANSASSITFTIPPNSSVAFPLYTQIDILTVNTGGVNIDPGSGVTLNGSSGNVEMLEQYSAATLIKVGTDAWLMASIKAASETATGVVELATEAEMNAGTDTLRVPSVKRVADYVAANAGGGVGVGQTWQNLTGSRAFDTSYRNTTGKPIQILVSVQGAINSQSNADLEVSADNSAWVKIANIGRGGGNGNSAPIPTVSAIIPDQIYYRITIVVGTPAINVFAELR